MKVSTNSHSKLPLELVPLLEQAGVDINLLKRFEPLTGGVASEVWLVEQSENAGNSKKLCLKRALPKLNVKQDWQVDVARSELEVLWFQTVESLLPETHGPFIPQILAHDAHLHAFVMTYFESSQFPLWKQQLIDNEVNTQTAQKLAQVLGKIHQGSARLPELSERFNNHDVFFQIRVEPYFLATAKKYPHLNSKIEELAQGLSSTQVALVHGDISPKNILVGENSPVILDAECAVFGDPAFDLAFLLNHMLLKSFLVNDLSRIALSKSFDEIASGYLPYVDWEEVRRFELRVIDYLGVFLLARIDGKSPVEYIVEEDDKNYVRDFGQLVLQENMKSLQEVSAIWQKTFNEK